MKRLIMGATGAAILCVGGCTTVENGSDRARQAAIGVGERVQYHAHKVERKTRSFWHWLFGDKSETTSRKPEPQPAAQPATKLPNYPQQYVGKPD